MIFISKTDDLLYKVRIGRKIFSVFKNYLLKRKLSTLSNLLDQAASE